MKKVIIAIMLAAAGAAWGDTVELNLFSLGCPAVLDFNSPYWQTNFDLGVTFSDISHVYIDWSGEITAGLAIRYTDPCNPFPLEVGIYAGFSSPFRHAEAWGGEQTYPVPEPFDSISEIKPSNWSDLLDGQGTIIIQYEEIGMLNGRYIESGLVMLSDATLIVEGTVIPEPATILFLSLGAGLMVRMRRSRTSL
ncbi:MAG: PEP-CTERM sorting domain-containing protein [Sedimentisphaerales bacterium]|nr:PEP-CTERM sorting domain-containing protein [Sedimentisphaerales bacterium]